MELRLLQAFPFSLAMNQHGYDCYAKTNLELPLEVVSKWYPNLRSETVEFRQENLHIPYCEIGISKLYFSFFRNWNKFRLRGRNSCVRFAVFGFNDNNFPFEMLLNFVRYSLFSWIHSHSFIFNGNRELFIPNVRTLSIPFLCSFFKACIIIDYSASILNKDWR